MYIFIFFISLTFSWVLHEFAHWVMGEYLGYKMIMTLNSTFPKTGYYTMDLHYQAVSAAGPVITLSEAILVFMLMIRQRKILLYPLLFSCFYMRLLATMISFLRANDEARISAALGIGKFTLPLIVTMILLALVYKMTARYRLNVRFNLTNLGLAILFSSIIILTDMYLKIKLI